MKKTILFVLFGLLLVNFTGCSSGNNLKGVWESNKLVLEFSNDSSGTLAVGSISNYAFGTSTDLYEYYFDYTASDDTLTLSITGSNSPYDALERYGTITLDYTLSGDKLIISNIQLGPNNYPDSISLTKTSDSLDTVVNQIRNS